MEREYGDKIIFLRANVNDPKNSELLKKYRFQWTPTFILFDRSGKEVWRLEGRVINRKEFLRQILAL